MNQQQFLIAAIALFILVIAVAFTVYLRAKKPTLPPKEEEAPKLPEARTQATVLREEAPEKPVVAPKPAGLQTKLDKTRGNLLGHLGRFLGRSTSAFDQAEWEALEEALLEGDVGVRTTNLLLERVKDRAKNNGTHELRELLVESSEELLGDLPHGPLDLKEAPKPYVISIVGVNGVGKTTTIGKLAHYYSQQGKSVLLGAADTFRAGAISQLKVWADRTHSEFVTGREGADPGAVSFDSVTAAKARNIDIVLLDTAGRLHTKSNLMDELKKIHRVIKKVIPEAPHERWLVVDGTLGQNSIQQAKEFQSTLELTGVIVTKLDGTAKGGALLSIAAELNLPIRFIGVGESVDDLLPFKPVPFVEAILGNV